MRPVVYFARSGANGPIKIGFSANLRQRVAALETSAFEAITILAVVDGDRDLECSLHEQFSSFRLKREWFSASDELLAYIAELEPYVAPKRIKRQQRAPQPPKVKTPHLRLRQWRTEQGWSRKKAAEFLGINVRTLESWEYGLRAPASLKLIDALVFNSDEAMP